MPTRKHTVLLAVIGFGCTSFLQVARRGGSVAPLLPIMAAVFIAFLVIGAALPVLPLHVHETLGLGTFLVGLVAGSQFAAAIVSRVWAGRHADRSGAKAAVVMGLLIAAAAGLLYFLSLSFLPTPAMSVTFLLLGRALLGVGESFIITGAQTWGLAIRGVRNTSKVLAWVGSAMFGAFAAGAPIGTALYARYGFSGIALATTLLPVATLALVATLPRVEPTQRMQAGFLKVFSAVWVPGTASALSSIGFGAMTAFSALLFVGRGWAGWSAFTVFATAFILTRFFLGHLADRFGGAKVALICVLVEAAGLALIWASPWLALALLGAALTGFGYSLVYPGFGVEAVRRAPARQSRARDRRLHRFPRRGAGVRHPGSRLAGGFHRSRSGVRRQHGGGSRFGWDRGSHALRAAHATAR